MNLSQNALESADGPEGAKRLPALKSLMQLQELNLNDNRLVDVSSLAEIPSLRKVWLQGNRIDEVQPVRITQSRSFGCETKPEASALSNFE